MAKKQTTTSFEFFRYLRGFYYQNQRSIRRKYTSLSQKFLDYNDPDKGDGSFLRRPQFEALEMYVFLKEGLSNQHLAEIFENWYHKREAFDGREGYGFDGGQLTMFAKIDEDTAIFEQVMAQLRAFRQVYPNYIFAHQMATASNMEYRMVKGSQVGSVEL